MHSIFAKESAECHSQQTRFWRQDSPELSAQAGANQFIRTDIGPEFIDGGADGIVSFELLETEGDEGKDRGVDFLIYWRKRALSAGCFPGSRRPNFIFQFDDDSFGRLFSDAADLREG